MDLYYFFGRVVRLVIAFLLLFTAINYAQYSLFETEIVEMTKVLEGEFSIEFQDFNIQLALNDSTFMLKIGA